jgi:hypothetical protein
MAGLVAHFAGRILLYLKQDCKTGLLFLLHFLIYLV